MEDGGDLLAAGEEGLVLGSVPFLVVELLLVPRELGDGGGGGGSVGGAKGRRFGSEVAAVVMPGLNRAEEAEEAVPGRGGRWWAWGYRRSGGSGRSDEEQRRHLYFSGVPAAALT